MADKSSVEIALKRGKAGPHGSGGGVKFKRGAYEKKYPETDPRKQREAIVALGQALSKLGFRKGTISDIMAKEATKDSDRPHKSRTTKRNGRTARYVDEKGFKNIYMAKRVISKSLSKTEGGNAINWSIRIRYGTRDWPMYKVDVHSGQGVAISPWRNVPLEPNAKDLKELITTVHKTAMQRRKKAIARNRTRDEGVVARLINFSELALIGKMKPDQVAIRRNIIQFGKLLNSYGYKVAIKKSKKSENHKGEKVVQFYERNYAKSNIKSRVDVHYGKRHATFVVIAFTSRVHESSTPRPIPTEKVGYKKAFDLINQTRYECAEKHKTHNKGSE